MYDLPFSELKCINIYTYILSFCEQLNKLCEFHRIFGFS